MIRHAYIRLSCWNAKVSILENPAAQTAPAVIRAMGLSDSLAKMGVELKSFFRFGPVKALPAMRFRQFELAQEYLDFDAYPGGIRCFCCQEHCPQGAITIRKGVLMGTLEAMERLARRIVSR